MKYKEIADQISDRQSRLLSDGQIVEICVNGNRYDIKPGFLSAYYDDYADIQHYIRSTGKKSWGHFSHGGKRKGAGRKRSAEPIVGLSATVYQRDLVFLRDLAPTIRQAVRKLIETRAK